MATGRLAPSPTGAQHLGNARTYLMAFWSARSSGSRLVMRIEDIDSPRVKPWATAQAIEDLRWLGIDWDEGPDIGGPNAPYIQTQRVGLYEDALEQLIADDRVFPCTCTRKDIAQAGSAPHFEHEGPVYPGTCAKWRNSDPTPRAGTFCWRFRAGSDPIEFVDRVADKQSCTPSTDLGDFPITQKNGQPSYQLAVVVDDGSMGITEVVRGNDLIPSTFRQIELFRALGFREPSFAHVPLILGPDGRRLAKRHGDTRLSHYREQGIAPERIVGWAAHNAGLIDSETPIKASDLTSQFSWSRVNADDFVIEQSTAALFS